MLKYRYKGNFSETTNFLKRLRKVSTIQDIEQYGIKGVNALVSATPRDTGLTAESWYYKIQRKADTVSLVFCNRNIQNGVPVAIILYYGHGTRNGGYVEGKDYINPALDPIFSNMIRKTWEEVSSV